jgi:hypothetical protein
MRRVRIMKADYIPKTERRVPGVIKDVTRQLKSHRETERLSKEK